MGPYTVSRTALQAQMGPPTHIEILAFTCDTIRGWIRDHFATVSCPARIVNVQGWNMATVPQDIHITELARDTTTGQLLTLRCTNCAILQPGTGPYTAFIAKSGLQMTVLYGIVGDNGTYADVFSVL